MFKKSRVRGSFDKWHGEQSETLLKSERRHLYHIYWSLGRQVSWNRSLLMICKILGLFVNLLTADEKYSLLKRRNLLLHILMHLSQKRTNFPDFFFFFFLIFINLDWILKIFKKQDTLLAHLFLKLRTPENVVC